MRNLLGGLIWRIAPVQTKIQSKGAYLTAAISIENQWLGAVRWALLCLCLNVGPVMVPWWFGVRSMVVFPP